MCGEVQVPEDHLEVILYNFGLNFKEFVSPFPASPSPEEKGIFFRF